VKKPPLRCARCNRVVKDGQYVYSRFTKNRYCIALDACKARAAKRK
jgi:hypothetical protein